MLKITRGMAFVLAVSGLLYLGAGLWVPLKATLAQYLLQRAWQKSIQSGTNFKPWPWADTWPVGRLRSARTGIDLIVLEGDSGEVLAFGPGPLQASSAPGDGGHSILVGHRDTSFSFVRHLTPGDLLTLEGKRTKRNYQVEMTEVVPAEKLYLDGTRNGLLTLVTCYPFDAVMSGTPFRFVVTASEAFGGVY